MAAQSAAPPRSLAADSRGSGKGGSAGDCTSFPETVIFGIRCRIAAEGIHSLKQCRQRSDRESHTLRKAVELDIARRSVRRRARAARVLPHLDRVKAAGLGRWIAWSPARRDRCPSLNVCFFDHCVRVRFFVGCKVGLVFDALGPPSTKRPVSPQSILSGKNTCKA